MNFVNSPFMLDIKWMKLITLPVKIPKILRGYPVQVGHFYGTIFRDDLDRTVSIMKFALASEYVESSSVFFGYDYWGKALPLLRQYWAGGYMAYLPREEKSTATSTLSSLKESKWLEKGCLPGGHF